MMWGEIAVRFYWQDPHQQAPKYFPKRLILNIPQASFPPVGGHASHQGSVSLPILTCLPYSSWWVWFIRLMLWLEWDSQQSIALWPTLWEVRGGRKASYLLPEHTLLLIFEKKCIGSLEVVPEGGGETQAALPSTRVWFQYLCDSPQLPLEISLRESDIFFWPLSTRHALTHLVSRHPCKQIMYTHKTK